jgi:uncharacterized protein (DUF1015 family)
MSTIRPFRAYRPRSDLAEEVAARPYDVLTSDEACIEVRGHPYSFLHVGKPEVDLDPSVDLYDNRVYKYIDEFELRVNSKHLIDSERFRVMLDYCASRPEYKTLIAK